MMISSVEKEDILSYFKDWEICKDDYEVTERFLGSGSFGNVLLGRMKRDHPDGRWKKDEFVAVKTLMDGRSAVSDFRLARELIVPCSVRLPGVMPLVGFVRGTVTDPAVLVTKYMTDGTMGGIIEKRVKGGRVIGWNDDRLGYVTYRLAKIMCFLHEHGYIHRDIKPENVLFGQHKSAMLGDFGCCRPLSISLSHPGHGTILYMAPETNTSNYGPKVDVYSFGMTLYRYWSPDINSIILDDEKTVIIDLTSETLIAKVSDGVRYANPGIPDVYWDLITDCWAHDPDDRPSFAEICARIEANSKEFCLGKTAEARRRFKEGIQKMNEEMVGTVDPRFNGALEILKQKESTVSATAPSLSPSAAVQSPALAPNTA